MGALLHQSPKFYNNVFLCVSLPTLGTLVNFYWRIQTFQPLILIYKRGNFVYSLGNLSAIVLSFISLQVNGHLFTFHLIIPISLNINAVYCWKCKVKKNIYCYNWWLGGGVIKINLLLHSLSGILLSLSVFNRIYFLK